MLSRTDLKPADAIRVELPRAPLQAPDEAVQLAQTLKENEEHLQGAVEAAGMGIWEFDVPTGATTWWPGMDRLHGMPPGSPTPDRATYQSILHPEDRDRVIEALERSIAGTGWHRLEYRVVWPDGTLHWLEARGRVKRDASGRPVTMAGVCQDITRRKHNELDLEFLAQASAELAGVADYQTTLDRIARLA
ncbi:MAG TPA: PAS domain-containing protein, partial [Ramlibacter sp.]